MLTWMFYPVFMLIVLMIILWLMNFTVRFKSVRAGLITPNTIVHVNHEKMPQLCSLIGKNYDNVMQQPILFMVLMAMLFQLQLEALWMQIVAFAFVGFRYWHSVEHIRATNLLRRTIAFGLATSMHWGLWVGVFIYVISKG